MMDKYKSPSSNSSEDSAESHNKKAKIRANCNYGEKCYRKKIEHFREYGHPHLEELLKRIGEGELHVPAYYSPEVSNRTLIEQLGMVREIEQATKPKQPPISNPESSCSSLVDNQTGQSSVNLPKRKVPELKNEVHAENLRQANNYRVVVLDRTKNKVTEKMKAAAPYNFFLTTVSDSKETHSEKLSLTFVELIDPLLGDLESSLQMNFMVEFGWLLAQYNIMGHRLKPLTLIYGEIDMDLSSGNFKHFLTSARVKPPSPFGSHHTKMMMFAYKDGSLRIVVSTANLVESDWDNRTQGLWVSPSCPLLADDSDTGAGESQTNFKRDLLKYLNVYGIPELQPWIAKVRKADLASIRVFFIASAPGSHSIEKSSWGQGALSRVLSKELDLSENWKIILQCSSIGSLGPRPDAWLTGEILNTFKSAKKLGLLSQPFLKLIYPSFRNVENSYDGLLGGGCLPYSKKTHQKQEWLISYLHQWKSECRKRTRAVPHIKSYCRVSPDDTQAAYFLLTSANLSKAAWGSYNKSGGLSILSYEAGVLMLPKYLINKDCFPLKEGVDGYNGVPLFPMPYDLPVTSYNYSDVPWFIENLS